MGRERPRRRVRGRVCDAEAGSLTPHLCSISCAGALNGRHRTPPGTKDGDPEKFLLSMHLAGAHCLRFISMDMRATLARR